MHSHDNDLRVARKFLEETLRGIVQTASMAIVVAQAEGFDRRVVERAARELGVKSQGCGPRMTWELPRVPRRAPEKQKPSEGEDPRFCIPAQPIDDPYIGFPLDVPRVVTEGDTLREGFLWMADFLGPVLARADAWDFKVGVGPGAMVEATEYLVEGPLVGLALTHDRVGRMLPPEWGGAILTPRARGRHVGATGPCYLTASPTEDEDVTTEDESVLLPEGLQAKGATLRDCLLAMTDELAPDVEKWHMWDLTMDVGEPSWPDQWGLPPALTSPDGGA